MKIRIFMVVLMIGIPAPSSADVKIDPFAQDLFSGCVTGTDIGKMTGSSDPISLLGSVVYTGSILGEDGLPKQGLITEPLALPITTSDASNPDTSTCERNFSVKLSGAVSFLGFALNASKDDIYRVKVRLMSRQKLSPISQNGNTIQVWHSDIWKPAFKQVLDNAPSNVSEFFIFNNIAIYLMDVEKYKKTSGGFKGAYGLITGDASYERDDSFKGTKLIVTGSSVKLSRSSFGPLPTVSLAVAQSNNLLTRALTDAEVGPIQSRLNASAQ